MTDLRKLARGQDCMIRIPGACNFNPETTVLAHYRLKGACGVGLKPPDTMGAFACSGCHDVVDRRAWSDYSDWRIDTYHLEGVMRTLAWLDANGYKMSKAK